MVRAVRDGARLREVSARFKVSPSTVLRWVNHAQGRRLDRVDFGNAKPGGAWNRTEIELEQRILAIRASLREHSVLGEYGPDAIGLALRQDRTLTHLPARTTIYRVLARHGLLDAVHRQRRPAPPKGWYLPRVAARRAELDSFDFIETLKIADGPLVDVLTATSLHGALADAWVLEKARATAVVDALLERWHREGLPHYAQFDNDTLFQGAHQFAHSVGRVSRLCLALGIVVVFAPPREPGFQNAIEGFNALWQSKVWRRHQVVDSSELQNVSSNYISAYRAKTAQRRDTAPSRRVMPTDFRLDLNAPLRGTIIFLRRTNARGAVQMLGTEFLVSSHWVHRLVRCEVNFTHQHIRFYALRRRDPTDQPLLLQTPYRRPHKPFQGSQ